MGGDKDPPPSSKHPKPPDTVTEEANRADAGPESAVSPSLETMDTSEVIAEETPANTGTGANNNTATQEAGNNTAVVSYAAAAAKETPAKVHVDTLRIVLKKTEAGASYHLKDKEKANLVFIKLGVPRDNVIGIENEDYRTILVTTNCPAYEWRIAHSVEVRSGLITLPMRMFKRLTKVTIMGVGVWTDATEVVGMLGHFGTFEDSFEVREKTYYENADLSKLNVEEKMLRGVKNGDREVKMYLDTHIPSFALLPNGKKVRVRYPAQPITCARCHQGIRGCRGGANAAKCEKKGGKQVPLKEFWEVITGQSAAAKDDKGSPEVQANHLRIEGLGKEAGQEWVKDLLKPSVTRPIENDNIIQSENKLAWQVTGLSLAEINDILQMVSGTQFKGKTVYCTPVVSNEIPKPKVSSSPPSESGESSQTPAEETEIQKETEKEKSSEAKENSAEDEYEKVARREKSAEKKRRRKEAVAKKAKETEEERQLQLQIIKEAKTSVRSKRHIKEVSVSPDKEKGAGAATRGSKKEKLTTK